MDHRIEQLKHLGLAERVRQLSNPVGPVGVAIGVTVNVTAGSSGHTNSPHPSSREGHHSTVRRISGFSYLI
jgi:hypothetical protein